MTPLFRRFVASNLSDRIVAALQDRQHLRPHATVREALAAAAAGIGFCPVAIEASLAALQLDGSQKIGRLTGCRLSQLGRTIHRIWRQRASDLPEGSPDLDPNDTGSSHSHHHDSQPA